MQDIFDQAAPTKQTTAEDIFDQVHAQGQTTAPTAPAAPRPSQTADYLKGQQGYILNPLNSKARGTGNGPATVLDENGKVWEIPSLNRSLPSSVLNGVISGYIKTNTPAPSFLDRIKSIPIVPPLMAPGNPFGSRDRAPVTVGNVAEGISGSLPTLRNTLRTAGAIGGGAIGGGAGAVGAAPTVAGIPVGAVGGAALGGAAGASIGESAYQGIDRLFRGGNDSPKTAGEALKLQGGAVVQGALQEGGGKAVSIGLGRLSNSLMERQVEQILAPSGNAAKADVAEVSAALAQDMPVAATRKTLLPKVNAKVDELGQAVSDAYTALRAAPNVSVPSAPIQAALEGVRDSYIQNGQPIAGAETIVNDFNKLINQVSTHPTQSPDEFRQIKQVWDEAINWSRNANARTPAMEKALTTGANAIRDSLHKLSPALEKADTAFSMWKTAQDALQNKVTSGVGASGGLVTNRTMMSTVLGGGIGAAVGGGPGALEGAAIADTLSALMNTTGYRTASIATKKAVNDLIAKGATQKAIGLILAQGSHAAEMNVPSIMEGTKKLNRPSNIPTTLKP